MSFISDSGYGIKSDSNNTTTPAAGFVGQGELNPFAEVMVTVIAEGQSGHLYFEFSDDNVVWHPDPTGGYEIISGRYDTHVREKGPRYFRVNIVLDGVPSSLSVNTYYGTLKQQTIPFNSQIPGDYDSIGVRGIDEISVASGRVNGYLIVNLPARNPEIDSGTVPTDIWEGGRDGSAYAGNYTGFPSNSLPAETFSLSSSSANDTAAGTGARVVRIFYLDDDLNGIDDNQEFIYEDVVLNGATPVATVNTGRRIWRAAVISSGSSQANEGDITCTWSTTTANAFFVMPAGGSVTQVSNFTIPNGWTGYLWRTAAAMNDKGSNRGQVGVVIRVDETDTYYSTRYSAISTDNDTIREYFGGDTFLAKTDIVWRCYDVSNNGADVSVDYDILLVKNNGN